MKTGYEIHLHSVEDIGDESFCDLGEFPPLDPDDERAEFGLLITTADDPLTALNAAERHTGAVRGRWVNAAMSGDEYRDFVLAGRPATASPDGHPWPAPTPRVSADTIRTTHLDLLPLRIEHAEEMAEVLSDPALHTFIGGTPDGPEALRARYERLVVGSPDPAVSWCNWVLGLREEGCLVGTVQATVVGQRAEIAWVLGARWQGRGLAKEAARGLVEWLAARSVRTVLAHIHPGHHASAAVAEAAGLSPTGTVHGGEARWELTVRPSPHVS